MKRTVLWVALVFVLCAQMAVGASYVAGAVAVDDAEALCTRNDKDGCDNNGCEGTGGVCGRALVLIDTSGDGAEAAASPCWCLY